MSTEVVQMATAAVGVLGTLSAGVLTHMFNRHSEHDRRKSEDEARWLTERLRVNGLLLSRALSIERKMWSVSAFLDSEEREQRLGGPKSIFMTPEEGVPGVLSIEVRELIVEALHETYDQLNELEETVAEISLIGSPDEARIAQTLHERLWDIAGQIEMYVPSDSAYAAVLEAKQAREAFALVARKSLRVSGELVTRDGQSEVARNSDSQ